MLLLNEYIASKKCFENFINLYESFNETVDDPEEYLWHLNLGIIISVFSDDTVLLWILDEKADSLLDSLPVKSKSTAVLTNYYTLKNSIIAYLTHIADFKEAKIRSENLQAEILTKKVKPSIRKIFLANLCQTYLCHGEIMKALQCYNAINNTLEYSNVRNDIDPGMSILGLAIFFELDSSENTISLVRSCKRKSDYKSKCKIYHQIIDFFAETIKTNEKKKILLLIEDMQEKIDNIDEQDSESIFFLKNTLIAAWLRKKHVELA